MINTCFLPNHITLIPYSSEIVFSPSALYFLWGCELLRRRGKNARIAADRRERKKYPFVPRKRTAQKDGPMRKKKKKKGLDKNLLNRLMRFLAGIGASFRSHRRPRLDGLGQMAYLLTEYSSEMISMTTKSALLKMLISIKPLRTVYNG